MSDRTAGLRPMFEARSVAVVGASGRVGSSGWHAVDQLVRGGFTGDVFPVNPNYTEIAGLKCYPTIADAPAADLALIAVPNRVLEEQMKAAAGAGVRAVVIFASGHDERGETTLLEPIARIASDAGIAVCGANCMGFVDLDRSLRALAYPEEELEPGGITWLAQSGSAFTALLHNQRGLRFNLAVSSGQELNTTVADYMLHALERDTTRVLALFLESVRDPEGFRRALTVAEDRGVPVVVLKVGNQELSRALVTAHSGALAGERGAYEALFDAHGVHAVETMDEMADLLELLSAGRAAGPGGLATVHDSGGERAHLIDVAATAGVELAELSESTLAALSEVLEPGLPAVNPLDAWGTGNDFDPIFGECMEAMLADDATAALALVVDLKKDDPADGYAGVAVRVGSRASKPFAVMSNLTSAIDPPTAAEIRAAGIPVLEGTATGLRAFKCLFAARDRAALPPLATPPEPSRSMVSGWRTRLAEPEPLSGAGAFALLEDFGIATIGARPVATLGDAMSAAFALGYPVAVKTDEPGVTHKTESGGVYLSLTTASAVADAYRDLAERIGPRALVQRMAPSGVEMALGIVRDAQFGPVLVVSAGGVLIETLQDRVTALPPLDEVRARRLIDRLRVRSLLEGVRGAPPADIGALSAAIVGLSSLASALGDDIAALDINPLIVTPEGCAAVDALLEARVSVPKRRAQGTHS